MQRKMTTTGFVRIKAGPRPFAALGTLFSLMLLGVLYLGIQTGKWGEASKMAGLVLAIAAMALGPIAFMCIEVDEDEIRVKKFGSIRKRARFAEIGQSFATVLAERDWPLSLTIIGKDRKSELMSINLKHLRKKDVAWLLALPELKVKR